MQRTGWGKSAVYFVATALLRAAGRGAHGHRLPAARADAQPDRRRRTGRGARGDGELGQHRRLGRHLRRDRRRRGRRPAGQPGAAEQPRLPRPGAAPARGERGPAGGGRGALRLRLGPRLPARLPADADADRRAAGRASRCWPPRPRPTTGWSRTSPSSWGSAAGEPLVLRGVAGPRVAAAVGGAAADAGAAAAWLAAHLAELPGSGIVYTLTVAAARGGRGVPARARVPGGRLHRQDRSAEQRLPRRRTCWPTG